MIVALVVAALRRPGTSNRSKRSRHPEVDHQRVARREIDQQILRTAAHLAHRSPFQTSDEIAAQRIAQIGSSGEHPRDPTASHRAAQLAPGVFDLRELGHALTIAHVKLPTSFA